MKSFDEFVYLETALGEQTEEDEQASSDRENARSLLVKALQAHGQRGELPVLATRLKQTMLLMDPAFNEANFGYTQFKPWLEDNRDLIKLFIKDLQLYAAPVDYIAPNDLELTLLEQATTSAEIAQPARQSLESQYRMLFSRMKMMSAELTTRRDVLRDIYRELVENPVDAAADIHRVPPHCPDRGRDVFRPSARRPGPAASSGSAAPASSRRSRRCRPRPAG